jgi:glycerophosphoryl diester phosphodiesterase
VPLRPFFHGPRPLVFAHRGGARLWPENTVPAFRGAAGLGCTHIETDVHVTRDGHLVIFHDERLERTTNGYGRLRDFSLAELEKLDAGYWFSPDGRSRPWRGKGVRIPTLEEVLGLDDRLRFNIEMKQRGVDLPRRLWELVESRDLHDRVLIASAEDALGLELRRLARGRVATSASAREVLALWAALRARLGRFVQVGYDALQVPPAYYGLPVVTPRFVEGAHALGLQVHVWTIDDPGEMRRLLALGVDGLMSDRPDLLMKVAQEPRP